jgi:hypothetical protein
MDTDTMMKETLMRTLALLLLLTTPALSNSPPKTPPTKTKVVKGQKEPLPQRVVEIQAALLAHNYKIEATGKWDDQTKTCLRDIANAHKWQVDHVPDARVLLLIGLGSKNQNPEVLTAPPDRLDELQRKKLGDDEE